MYILYTICYFVENSLSKKYRCVELTEIFFRLFSVYNVPVVYRRCTTCIIITGDGALIL